MTKMETRSQTRQRSLHHENQSDMAAMIQDGVQQNGTDTQTTARTGGGQQENKGENVRLPTGALIMFVSLLLDLLAFTMILPLLPSILEYYGNQQDGLYTMISRSMHGFREIVGAPDTPKWNSVFFGGLIGSLYSTLQFISNPLMGAASDVYGRRPILLISLVGISVSHLIWMLSSNFTIFVLARIIGGISKGNISLSTAIMTDLLPEKRRGRGMALVGVAFSLGFLIGPMIGAGFAIQLKEQKENAGIFFFATAVFALVLSLIDLVFVYCCFKESLPEEKRASSLGNGVQRALDLINPLALFKFSAVPNMDSKDLVSLRKIGLAYFMYLFLYSGLEFTLTFLAHNRFNYDSMKQGRMFFLIGFIMILVQGGYVRRLKQGTEKKLVLRGMLILIPSLVIVGLGYKEAVMYIGLILFSFASATVVPCVTTIVSNFGTDDQKGTVLGIFRSLGALARAVGPVAASTMYWSAGSTSTYITGGLLITVPFLIFKSTTAKETKKD